MLNLYVYLRSWLAEQKGQDLAEYALLLAVVVVAIAAIAGFTNLDAVVANAFTQASSAISGGS